MTNRGVLHKQSHIKSTGLYFSHGSCSCAWLISPLWKTCQDVSPLTKCLSRLTAPNMSDIHKGNHGAANPNICQNRDVNPWWLGCGPQSVFSQSPKTHCVIKLKQFIFYPDLGSVDCRYFNCLKSFIYIFFVSNAINEKLVSIVYVEAEGKGGGGYTSVRWCTAIWGVISLIETEESQLPSTTALSAALGNSPTVSGWLNSQ